jgi:hypothetical protein
MHSPGNAAIGSASVGRVDVVEIGRTVQKGAPKFWGDEIGNRFDSKVASNHGQQDLAVPTDSKRS